MTVHFSDYKPTQFSIEEVILDFDLDPSATRVRSRMSVKRTDPAAASLKLDGEHLVLERVAVDGTALDPDAYEIDERSLTIHGLGERASIEIETRIAPAKNTELTGLYMSGGRFCTQCEAQGFRRITYFLDRPDCLARYRVRVEADKVDYPTLLSNGDAIESGELAGGRHFAVFEDPHLKPAYLFALVAGRFESIEDNFTTRSDKPVRLVIHVDPGQSQRARFAMDALKRSMAWDEKVFGREYDLSVFHIVAVRDFNYGAMENKGLNVFNSSVLLADPASATDADFLNVERVVAHEYFHNWTGNRITLRDWFQLCLKEGLTIYRDQEFSSDHRNRALQRISDVENLRAFQFPEDDGPLSHPPRPEAYETIDNFYTPTVYKKGAEVVRVLRGLVGETVFRAGMQRYFERCDGTAATLEDFVGCFDFPDDADRAAAFRWYEQAGTPRIIVKGHYDAAAQIFELTVSQTIKPSPDQPVKAPLPIPLRIGFLNPRGESLHLRHKAHSEAKAEHRAILRSERETFVFHSAQERPIPTVLRGFNAPVRITTDLSDDDRLVQMARDPDPFTRWDAGQSLMAASIIAAAEGRTQSGPDLERITVVLRKELTQSKHEPGFAARAIRPPALADLFLMTETPDPEAIFQARAAARRTIATSLSDLIEEEFGRPAPDPASLDNEAIGRRALRSAFLSLEAARGPEAKDRLVCAYDTAANMTEAMAALRALAELGGAPFDRALEQFEGLWRDDPLVMDKWFSVQAASPTEGLERAERLARHELFTLKNPNRARSLYGAFSGGNPRLFHAADGSGYTLLADAIIELDRYNPMTAARLIRSFESWRRFSRPLQRHAIAALKRIKPEARSPNLKEMVHRTLG